MGRPIRIEYPGALYHITSRGNEKKDIFVEDLDRGKFLDILKDYHDRYKIIIHCFVLMSNHYHLILETTEGNLLKVMHGINSSYTGYFNRKYGRIGHLFQGRYKGIIVDKDSYLLELSRYVHMNPVKAGMVKKPEDYSWSSYPGYLWKRRQFPWMEYNWTLSQFGSGDVASRKRYRSFVEKDEDKAKGPLDNILGQAILGGEDFIKKVKILLKDRKIGDEVVDRKKLRALPKEVELISKVARAFDVSEEKVRDRGRRHNKARKAAIYLLKQHSSLSNRDIGALFGGIHPSAVTKTAERVYEELKKDKMIQKVISEINSIVKA